VPRCAPAALALLALVAAGCGGDDGDDSSSARKARASASGGRGGCRDVEQPRPKPGGGERKPSRPLEAGRRYEVTLVTSCGDLTILLDQRTSPRTAASFASLAGKRFFDGTTFHRIVPGFVIQGGDPTGTGSGGPGYSTRDEPPGDTVYARGTVAMAKTAQEPPGTAGSQFYIVTGDASSLPPEYALLGRVVKGLGAADRIERLGDRRSGELGTPLRTVVIERARVHAS
jgi:peptidyl-prolyl cis-trans isomerase B (cyclophilin B)